MPRGAGMPLLPLLDVNVSILTEMISDGKMCIDSSCHIRITSHYISLVAIHIRKKK